MKIKITLISASHHSGLAKIFRNLITPLARCSHLVTPIRHIPLDPWTPEPQDGGPIPGLPPPIDLHMCRITRVMTVTMLPITKD